MGDFIYFSSDLRLFRRGISCTIPGSGSLWLILSIVSYSNQSHYAKARGLAAGFAHGRVRSRSWNFQAQYWLSGRHQGEQMLHVRQWNQPILAFYGHKLFFIRLWVWMTSFLFPVTLTFICRAISCITSGGGLLWRKEKTWNLLIGNSWFYDDLSVCLSAHSRLDSSGHFPIKTAFGLLAPDSSAFSRWKQLYDYCSRVSCSAGFLDVPVTCAFSKIWNMSGKSQNMDLLAWWLVLCDRKS